MDQPANHLSLRGGQTSPSDRMRDLLARTVQDHVSDQRSHASALEQIRKHLEGLEWLVKEIREHELVSLASQLTAQTEAMRRQLAEVSETRPAWAESLPGNLESLSAQMKPMAELPSLWAGLGVMSENVDQVLPRLEAICDLISQAQDMLRVQEGRLNNLQQHGDQLQQSMESAAARFSRLDKALTELSQRAAYLDKELSAIKGRIDQGLAAQTARFDQGLAGLSERLEGTLDVRLGDTDDKVSTVDNKLGAVDAKLTGTDGKVGALANRIDRLDDHIGDTDDRIGLINERIAGIDEQLGTISSQVATVSERTAPLADRLTALDAALIRTDGKVGALDTRIGELGQRITDTGEQAGTLIEHLGERLIETSAQIGGLDEHIVAVSGTLGAHITAVDEKLGGHISAVDDLLSGLGTRMDGLDGRLGGVGGRIEGMGARFEAVDGRLESVTRQLGDLPTALGLDEAQRKLAEATAKSNAVLANRLEALEGRLAKVLSPLTDELRSRPGHAEVEDVVSKVVTAVVATVQSDMANRLDSLEETVLTLAEALLRPNRRTASGQRGSEHA